MTDHKHNFQHWPFPDAVATLTYCTGKVVRKRFPVLQVTHDYDGNWQFLDATTDEPGEPVLLCLGCVVEADATLMEVADLPIGWSAYREEIGAAWERWQNEREEEPDAEPSSGCDHSEGAMARREEKALADIEAHGLQVISVMGDDSTPPFAYSIGIEKSLGMPELFTIGLHAQTAHGLINDCYQRMKAGLVLSEGMQLDGLLAGDYRCIVGAMHPSHYKNYMGWARWLHGGDSFRTWQIVFPSSTDKRYPWDPDATEQFKELQPLFSTPAAS